MPWAVLPMEFTGGALCASGRAHVKKYNRARAPPRLEPGMTTSQGRSTRVRAVCGLSAARVRLAQCWRNSNGALYTAERGIEGDHPEMGAWCAILSPGYRSPSVMPCAIEHLKHAENQVHHVHAGPLQRWLGRACVSPQGPY